MACSKNMMPSPVPRSAARLPQSLRQAGHLPHPAALLALAAAVAALAALPAAAQTITTPPKGGGKPAAQRACAPGEPSLLRDQALAVKVSTKLQFNKALLREKFDVQVNGGVATLSGNMTTREHIALAVKLASAVQGVRCVNNQLKLGPTQYEDPAPRNL